MSNCNYAYLQNDWSEKCGNTSEYFCFKVMNKAINLMQKNVYARLKKTDSRVMQYLKHNLIPLINKLKFSKYSKNANYK